jgi:hypothetical protein
MVQWKKPMPPCLVPRSLCLNVSEVYVCAFDTKQVDGEKYEHVAAYWKKGDTPVTNDSYYDYKELTCWELFKAIDKCYF